MVKAGYGETRKGITDTNRDMHTYQPSRPFHCSIELLLTISPVLREISSLCSLSLVPYIILLGPAMSREIECRMDMMEIFNVKQDTREK